jgi:hypothetical protein
VDNTHPAEDKVQQRPMWSGCGAVVSRLAGRWALVLVGGRLGRSRPRLANLFAQGLQTRGPLELDLGERIEAL